MADYRRMYLVLLDTVEKAIAEAERINNTTILALLTAGEQAAEELYIESSE